jgi:hypothetical protein
MEKLRDEDVALFSDVASLAAGNPSESTIYPGITKEFIRFFPVVRFYTRI